MKKIFLITLGTTVLLLNSFVLYAQSLNLDKYHFKPKETINVQFKAGVGFASNAWIGIVPAYIAHGSETENDKYDLSYQYLNNKSSGILTFTAPEKPGLYDFRMHNTDRSGKEVAHITFVVLGKNDPSLSLDKTVFNPNEEIEVHFKSTLGFASNAWVGIIPSNVAHGSEAENDKYDLAYQYLQNKASGTLMFKAPVNVGKYDFRMHDTDNNGKEVAYVSFEVK